MPDDPVETILRRAPMSDAVRATAWDAVQQSTSDEDLMNRLKVLPFPDRIKADLWDAGHARLGNVASNAKREPTIGANLHQEAKMSAATPGTGLPSDQAIGESQQTREMMNTPLARPTGIDAIDSLTSPTSLISTAASFGGPALRIAGRAASHVPIPSFSAVRAIGSLLIGNPKPALKAAAQLVLDELEQRGAVRGASQSAATEVPATAEAVTAIEPAPALMAEGGRPWGTPKPTLSVDELRAKLAAADAARPVPAPAEAPAPAARVSNPGTALQMAKDTFAKLGETPRPAEASNAGELIRRGVPPDQAVATVMKNRPKVPLSPVEQLAQMPGAMSDAEVRAALDARNARGQIKSPSAQTARERRGN